MKLPAALLWCVIIICTTYACTTGGTHIDCHNWTAEECIAFVESIKQLGVKP